MTNTACALAALEIAPSLVARVGKDTFGVLALEQLKSHHIDPSHVLLDPDSPTGTLMVAVTPDGERTMFTRRGASCNTSPDDIQPELFLNTPQGLHISGYSFLASPQREAVWKAVGLAKQQGVPVSLDTELIPIQQAKNDIWKMISQTDICILGKTEIAELFQTENIEEAAQKLLLGGPRLVAVKLGSRGCYLASSTEHYYFPVFPITVQDSTGAGDSFSAGILFGSILGMPLSSVGIIASALGAIAASTLGGAANKTNLPGLINFLQQQKHNPASLMPPPLG